MALLIFQIFIIYAAGIVIVLVAFEALLAFTIKDLIERKQDENKRSK
ncbi:MAG: hypothetical protein PHD05_10020 [Sphaerochaetaceae bacterium]|nr:hypothetical protein [Sphaerochaetaceae bacterium]